jgi:uncharacterized protein YchJ
VCIKRGFPPSKKQTACCGRWFSRKKKPHVIVCLLARAILLHEHNTLRYPTTSRYRPSTLTTWNSEQLSVVAKAKTTSFEIERTEQRSLGRSVVLFEQSFNRDLLSIHQMRSKWSRFLSYINHYFWEKERKKRYIPRILHTGQSRLFLWRCCYIPAE